jgi:PUA domain protein
MVTNVATLLGPFSKMFKKYEPATQSQMLKSSAQRAIRQQISEQFPGLELEEILPKKSPLLCKKKDIFQYITVGDEILFFNCFNGHWMPTLLLLHKYPDMMTKVQVDKGAIKFILNGADIMCPGLTSNGGSISADLAVGTAVAVYAEGKTNACAIGLLKMSSNDIISTNKGIGIENVHFLGDGLFASLFE